MTAGDLMMLDRLESHLARQTYKSVAVYSHHMLKKIAETCRERGWLMCDQAEGTIRLSMMLAYLSGLRNGSGRDGKVVAACNEIAAAIAELCPYVVDSTSSDSAS